MRNMMTQKKTERANRPDPSARAARWCAAGLAVLLAATLFLRFGYSRSQVRLDITQGDASALAGFTLSGQSGGNAAGVDWFLQDGQLTAKAELNVRHTAESAFSTSFFLAMRPQDREKAEEAAEQDIYYRSSSGDFAQQYLTQTDSAYKMILVWLDVQDGGDERAIRFPCAELTDLDEPITWYTVIQQNLTADTAQQQAWGSDYSGSETAATTNCALDAFRFVCSGNVWYYTVQAFDNSLVTPGLYRVDSALTSGEIAALPLDTTAAGVPVRSNAAAYGETTLLYAFGSGSAVSGVQAMPDGGVCVLLAEDTETGGDRQEKLLFFDKDGQLADEYTVFASGADGLERRAELLQNQRADEVAFTAQDGADSAAVTVLRVTGGKVTHSVTVPLTAEQFSTISLQGGGYDWYNRVDTAALSEDAARILLTERQYTTASCEREFDGIWLPSEETVELNCRTLTVYDAAGGTPLLTATLDPGNHLTWGTQILSVETGGSSMNRWIDGLTYRGGSNGFFDVPARRAAVWPDAQS